jgi:hypothetical protein
MSKAFGNNYNWILLVVVVLVVGFNQYQISEFGTVSGHKGGISGFASASDLDLSSVDVNEIQSTAQGIALLYPLAEIANSNDAVALMVPSGTPDYAAAMGVTFDDPVSSLSLLESAYPALKAQAQEDQVVWNRYLNLAAEPRGVSCEFCCGVGAAGVTADGQSKCGCAHNPALQSVTLWLLMNTEYTDAEVLKEVYNWKTIFFPRNMVELGVEIAGGNTDVLAELPGMVGGC